MEVKKAIKKVIALGAGASMIGATLLGAMAADLTSYPSPFVKDGKFDAFIVVGQDAQPEDVVGAVDIGASLQFEMRKATTVVTGAAAEATVTSGLKIEKTGNKFNYLQTIADVQATPLGGDDIPTLLADGQYTESKGNNDNDQKYTQELAIENGNAQLIFDQNDKYMPTADAYLEIAKKKLYNYTLEFDNSVKYDNSSETEVKADLEGTTIKIQGQTYTITEVEASAAGNAISKITMLSGETVLWLQQDQPITKTVDGVDHTVTVVDVTEDAKSCLVKVDDTQLLIDVGSTQKVSGVEVGVTDAKTMHAQLQDTDICEVSVGASKLILEDGKKVVINGGEVKDSNVLIMGPAGNWDGLKISETPNKKVDLAAGQAWTDPVFNNWKIVFGGMSQTFESIALTASGDDGMLDFNNNDHRNVEVPIVRNATLVEFGSDFDAVMLFNGTGMDTCTSPSVVPDVEDCEGALIWGVTAGGEAHVLEVTGINVDGADSTISIDDQTYDKSFDDKAITLGSPSTIDLGRFGNIVVIVDNNTGTLQVTEANAAPAKTDKGAIIVLTPSTTTPGVDVSEADIDEGIALNTISMDAYNETADDKLGVEVTGITGGVVVANAVPEKKDSDNKISVTERGTIITEDSQNHDSIYINYSDANSFGNVFITPIAAEVTTAAGGVVTYDISKINVGAARLDTEISSVTSDNLISVGGPCVNKVSAQVMGLTYKSCGADSGIPENAGMIKLFTQSTGKVSLVVAGWTATDTRRATRVLSDPARRSSLTGTSVKVTGTSLTDITVSPMQ